MFVLLFFLFSATVIQTNTANESILLDHFCTENPEVVVSPLDFTSRKHSYKTRKAAGTRH